MPIDKNTRRVLIGVFLFFGIAFTVSGVGRAVRGDDPWSVGISLMGGIVWLVVAALLFRAKPTV